VRVGDGEPTRCRVSDRTDLAASVLVQSWGKPGKPPKAAVRAVGPATILETYSAGIKLAMVARGEADLYVNDYVGFKDWDVCAGHALVEEAGGMLTEFGGGPILYGRPEAAPRRGMIASNSAMHAEVVRRVAGVL
jgi:3'(2'), 5'-bisphosphate nucleotidase